MRPAHRRDERDRLEHDAERRPDPQQHEQAVVVLDLRDGRVAGDRGEGGEDADPDEVVDDRDEADRAEAVARREHRRHEADRPVEEELGREESEELDGDRVLGRGGLAEREQRDERRRGEDEGDRRDDEDDARHRDDRRDRLDRFLLGPRRQPLDEDRDERRREDPPEDEVVQRVRCVIRQVERVGEA